MIDYIDPKAIQAAKDELRKRGGFTLHSPLNQPTTHQHPAISPGARGL